MKFGDTVKAIFFLAVTIILLFGVGSCAKWSWNECRKVGHGKLYCALHLGK